MTVVAALATTTIAPPFFLDYGKKISPKEPTVNIRTIDPGIGTDNSSYSSHIDHDERGRKPSLPP